MNNFLSSTGPRTVYFTYQPALKEGPGGELVPFGGKLLTVGDKLSALVDEAAKAVYFVRVAKDGVGTKAPEQDICSGEVNQEGLECFQSTLQVRLLPRQRLGARRWLSRRASAERRSDSARAPVCRSCTGRCSKT
jgi:hypothetical protein